MHRRIEHHLPEHERIHAAKHRDARLHHGENAIDIFVVGQGLELFFQQGVIRGVDLVTEDVLHHLVALVHGLLNQGIAAEGADDVHARHVAFVLGGQGRQGVGVLAGEFHPEGFHETALGHGAEAGNDAMHGHGHFPVGGGQHKLPRGAVEIARIHPSHAGAIEAGDVPGLDGRQNQRNVAILRPGEFVAAVHDGHGIVLRQGHGVLDGRIAGAHHHDGFALVFVRVVELVLHKVRVVPRGPKLPRIPLHPNAQDDRFCLDHFAGFEGEAELALLPLDRLYPGAVADIHTMLF